MKIIIDRFEGDYAVVEINKQKFVNIPKVLLKNAKEGDIISINIEKSETEKQKSKIEKGCFAGKKNKA